MLNKILSESESESELNMSIMIIISKCVNLKVYTAVYYTMYTGQGFYSCLSEDYPYLHVTHIHWILSIHYHNNRKLVARFQLKKLGPKQW